MKNAQPESIHARLAEALERDWPSVARPSQLAPSGDWRIWLLLAGRGFGKTRSGAEWVREQAETGKAGRIALVAPTAADVRDVIIEGESGLLAIAPDHARPLYEPSKRRLTWPNGAIATAYSADEPERLRGPQHDAAWCDELASWRYPDAWDMLMLGLRLGKDPRAVVTTTPKPTRLLRDLLSRAGTDVAVTRGSTMENEANLASAFLAQIVRRYEGTRLGRQELDAELLDDAPNAMWTRDLIERAHVAAAPSLRRIVVAIDPATTSGEESDETGIVVAGVGVDGEGYVLDDLSGRLAPTEWARRAVAAYQRHEADRVVAEVNAGGEMVEATLRVVDRNVSFKAVHASKGKVARAEPVAALYEQGRVHHVGAFPALEDQMCSFTTGYDRSSAGMSPDRLDALVWALTELMLGTDVMAYIEFYQRRAARDRGEHVPLPPPRKAPRALPAPPARPLVALRAPAPWANYAPGRGVRYCADAEGLINADPEHVAALRASGCIVLEREPS
jgi:predicted phage terminase large subunit-like protein